MRDGIARVDANTCAKATTNRRIIFFLKRGRMLIATQWLLMCVVNVVGGTNSYLFLVANNIVKNRQNLLKARGEGHTQAVKTIGDGVVHVLQSVHGELVLVEAFLGDEAVHIKGAREGSTLRLIAD